MKKLDFVGKRFKSYIFFVGNRCFSQWALKPRDSDPRIEDGSFIAKCQNA